MRNLRYGRAQQVLVAMVAVQIIALVAVFAVTRGGPADQDPFQPLFGVVVGVAAILFLASPFILIAVFGVLWNVHFENQVPGVLPAVGEKPRVILGRPKGVVPVRFSPPDGMSAAETGTLLAGGVSSRHLAASIVELARRGYIVVTPVDGGSQLTPGRSSIDELAEHEQVLLHGLFDDRPSVTTVELAGRSKALLQRVRVALGRQAHSRGWLRANPTTEGWGAVATGIVLASFALWYFGAIAMVGLRGGDPLSAGGWAWVVIAWLLPATFVAAALTLPIARGAVGAVMAQQAEGFRLYLATAEARQLRADEADGYMSQYLSYAIAFGMTDRWRRVIDDMAAEPRSSAAPSRPPDRTLAECRTVPDVAPAEPAPWLVGVQAVEDALVAQTRSTRRTGIGKHVR